MLEVGAFPRVLDSERADIALSIDVELGVLVEILGLDDATGPELDAERVSVLEVLDLHGSNERSKNALCTVSPFGQQHEAKASALHLFDRRPAANLTVQACRAVDLTNSGRAASSASSVPESSSFCRRSSLDKTCLV